MAVFQPEQSPPRLALGLYKRFLLAAVVIFMATSAAVATAALLEVKDAADIFDEFSTPIAGINAPNVLDDVDPGGPADDRRPRLGPALRRHRGQDADALGHDHPRAPGPRARRDRGHVAAA
jgi:hypothetical protein